MKKLLESLPGKFKYAYHRTWTVDAVDSITLNGYMAGDGHLYGKGWYMCYDIESQLNPRMGGYGSVIVKSELFDKGILIFDYNLSKQIYGSKYTIIDQLISFGVANQAWQLDPWWRRVSAEAEETLKNKKYSAVLAAHCFVDGSEPSFARVHKSDTYPISGWQSPRGKHPCLDSNSGKPLEKKITAIMFTGNNDGDVVVVYNENTATPVAFAMSTRNDLNAGQKESDLEWQPIKNMKVALKRSERLRAAYDLFKGQIDIEIRLKDFDLNQFKKDYLWIMLAETRGAHFIIHEDGKFEMSEGEWVRGEWKGDLFNARLFSGGKFTRGEFSNQSVFKYGSFWGDTFKGRWQGGIWYGGTWDPTWAVMQTRNNKMRYCVNGAIIESDQEPDQCELFN